MTIRFETGDRVRHPGRPEWGEGVVESAQALIQGGREHQRLGIRFERAGLKTLTTQHVSLTASGSQIATAAPPGEPPDPSEVAGMLEELPDGVIDPFASLEQQLAAALDLYRFTDEGASLLDWASTQTRLGDPLSVFTRHDLEAGFQRFRRNLDRRLAELTRKLMREDGSKVSRLAASAPPDGVMALRRIIDTR